MRIGRTVAWAGNRWPGSPGRPAAVLAGAIALYYALLGLVALSPEAVYSGDIGVKYVQAQALVANRFRTLDIPYPGEFLDPQRKFLPLRPPFVMYLDGTIQAIFPPSSSLLQAASVAVAGFRGMILVTLAAAALMLAATRRLAPPSDAVLVVVALGLASPLWFYAVSGWEHAPGVALGVLGFSLALSPRALPFLAGAALGAGATIRDEVILLVPGLLLAVWVANRKVRPVTVALAGVLVPLALAMALEVWWFERPPAAHLRHAVHVLQAALDATDAANPDVPVLRPMTRREQYEAVVQYWLLGYGDDRWILAFSIAGAIALVIRWTAGSSAAVLVWLAGILGLAAIDFHELMTAPKWLAGLLRVAPYLVFALFPMPRGAPDSGRFPLVALATSAAYLVLAFIGADTHGGKSLGPRLLLPLLPLLTVAAVMKILAYLRHGTRVERWAGGAGVLLLSMSLLMHVFGTTVAYYVRNRDDSTAILTLAASRTRIVATDDMYTAQLLLPLYRRKVIFLADSRELGAELGQLLADHRIPEVVLVSRRPEPLVTLSPLRLDRVDLQGRMLLQYYRR